MAPPPGGMMAGWAGALAFSKLWRGPRTERLRRILRRPLVINGLLAAWFVAWLLYQRPIFNFNDGYLYWLAASAWIASGDPWSVATGPHADFHFSGLPPSVLAFVPLTPFDGRVVAVALGLVSVFAAYVIVRTLRLPIAFLLFPPIVEGIGSANPHLALMALLVTGVMAPDQQARPTTTPSTRPDRVGEIWSHVSAVVASLLKIYAIVPIIGERRPRLLVTVAAAFALSVVVAPGLWSAYLARLSEIVPRLRAESAGGFEASGFLLVLVVPAVAWLSRRQPQAAGWLMVPALWPASQFFYWTFAMPVLPIPLLALLAIRVPALAALATVGYALWLAVDGTTGGDGSTASA